MDVSDELHSLDVLSLLRAVDAVRRVSGWSSGYSDERKSTSLSGIEPPSSKAKSVS